jgi:endonuclease/exonuclease/phosphatase family metal-dependent hydrolase
MRSFSFLIYAALIASVSAVRVCTFNMRAPVDGPPNDWASRKGRVAQVIVGHECAVVGLQEAQHDTVQDLLGELNARTSGNTSYCLAPFGGVDNAIAFYCHMAVIDTKEWAISDTPDQIGSNTWGLAYARTLTFVKLTLSANMRGANKTMIYVYAPNPSIISLSCPRRTAKPTPNAK